MCIPLWGSEHTAARSICSGPSPFLPVIANTARAWATPSASQSPVIRSAAAFTCGSALAMAIPIPAAWSMGTSLPPSPMAMTCSGLRDSRSRR